MRTVTFRLYIHDMDVRFQRDENDKSLIGEFATEADLELKIKSLDWPRALMSVQTHVM